ncbi:MAG TPA: glycosyltransferase family 1 protein [Noviherbaspirillum sp.]|nr:glycosyltransferase family 1 protein [Noviherbaspirillum sp.]
MELFNRVRVGINAVPILSPLTGVGQYTYRLITELQQILPHKPWLFYGTSWDSEIRTAAAPGARELNNAIKRFMPHPHLITRFLKQTRFSSGARTHRINLYHEPAFLAYRFKGPSVVTVHDLSWIRHPETHPAERVREMNRFMPKVIAHATHVVVDSDFVRREVISHYGVLPERVTTVLLGVSPDFRPCSPSETAPVLARFGLQHGHYQLAVGTLEPRKNLSTVIAAFEQLPDKVRSRFPLVIVGMNGWGMERFSQSLQHMISRGEVRMLGYVAQAELPILYAGARLFVYPSLYEGFGLPPLEAMACGVPVIASNRASLPEVVGNAGILVEPKDDASIASHMLTLIEDSALHARLSEAGRARASAFTWRKFAHETIAVYKKIIA